ncbi:MAG TPA: flagellar biosynthetic protein FliR [Pirellulales bacterium]|nr:flagellar biosynthetic protein FliR [Pirellulales bacterium]
MPAPIELISTHLYVLLLVLGRVGGLVTTAPLFSAIAVPKNIRAILALALAVLLAPAQVAHSAAQPESLVAGALAVGVEVLIGLALGLGTALLIAGAQLAGQLIAQLSGLSLAEVFDPNLGAETPLLSQLLGLFGVAVYLLIGGHRWLLAGLLDSSRALPIGGCHLPEAVPHVLVSLVSESFSLGIRIAVPAVLALLLASIMLGLVSRTITQLNVMSLGFGLNVVVALFALAMSLGSAAWLLEDQVQPTVKQMIDTLQATPTMDRAQ